MIDLTDKDKIEISGKDITVIGLGRSGSGAARLAHNLGARVFASDPSEKEIIRANLAELSTQGIKGETGRHSDRIYDADLWVISPGVPRNADIIRKAVTRKIPIVGEVEFAFWYTQQPIVAVTGSNGKTTTVHVLAEMCQTDTVHGVLSGNVGIAFSDKVREELAAPDPKRIYVLEISSFQMEFIRHFQPFISVFLNFTPDHLDRHATIEEYLSCKLALAQNQTGDDYIVYNADDITFATAFADHPAQTVPFSVKTAPGQHFQVTETAIIDEEHAKLINREDIALPGSHNLANLLAAATAANLVGVPAKAIRQAMESFTGVPHRLESVATITGVRYINDSKATNLDAVTVALDSVPQPLILLLGGKDKGSDFSTLIPHLHNVKTVIAYGQAQQKIVDGIGDAVRSIPAVDLKDAVTISQKLASSGDAVLLSPGCASFDQFENFEDRGDQFKSLVHDLEQIA